MAVFFWLCCSIPEGHAQWSAPQELVQAVQTGDDERALRLLSSLPQQQRARPEARYLEGRLLERMKRPREAVEAFSASASGVPSQLQRDVRRRRAALLLELGEPGAACPLYSEMLADGERGPSSLSGAGRCALAHGKTEEAITHLRQALSSARRGRANHRMRLAVAYRRAGQRKKAIEQLRRMLLDHPTRTSQVLERLAKLGASTKLSHADRIERAERFSALAMHDEALEELDALKPPRGRKLRASWFHARGMALFSLRTHYDEAAKVLARAARLRGDTADSDAFHSARALARADKDRQAVLAFRRFTRRYPRSRFVARAQYLAAWLEMRHGFGAGERNMRRFIDGRTAKPARRLVEKGTFELALRALERERYPEAKELFERYAGLSERTMVKARGLYWAGRAGAAAGLIAQAHDHYRAAISVEPLHYYALLAASRLREAGVDPGPPFGSAAAMPGSPPPLELTLPLAVRFYLGLGLIDDARSALRQSERILRAAAARGRETETLCAAYYALGEYSRAYRLVVSRESRLLHMPLSDANRWAWSAAYPQPFAPLVKRAAQRYSVPVGLVYAVMRKESAYNPSVISYANAVGLMQLLPKTARSVADDPSIEREQLLEPAKNIELGTRYLGQLLRRFGRQAPLAIAAYNAGGHRIDPWIELTDPRDDETTRSLDLFVERIPIDQTRNYVRRVLGLWARYRYSFDPGRGWPLSLPTEVVSSTRASSSRRRR